MDYFAFFDLPRRFFPDTGAIRRAYLAKSRQYHPDQHSLSLAAEQSLAEELAGINNQAYQALTDPDRRLAHILRLEDRLPEEGTAELPSAFLLEMMDLNEALMELDMDPDPDRRNGLLQDLRALEDRLAQEVRPVMEAYDRGDPVELEPVTEYYLKRRYLSRLWKNLQKGSENHQA